MLFDLLYQARYKNRLVSAHAYLGVRSIYSLVPGS